MNRKLHRILDDIQNTEKKIAVWQNHLDELNARKEMLENAEIIKSIRSMRLGSRELLSALEGVQNGTIILSEKQKAIEGLEENGIMADLTEENETLENIGSEREVLMNEREN